MMAEALISVTAMEQLQCLICILLSIEFEIKRHPAFPAMQHTDEFSFVLSRRVIREELKMLVPHRLLGRKFKLFRLHQITRFLFSPLRLLCLA